MLSPSVLAELANLMEVFRRLAAPTPVPLARWAAHLEESNRGKADTTRYNSRQAVREAIALAPEGGTTADLTLELVRQFAAKMATTRKGSTVNTLLRSLRAACNVAVRQGWLGIDPVKPADPWLEEQRKRKHHSREDIARVLGHLAAGATDWEGRRLHAWAALLAYTGLRRGESLRLKVSDINLEIGFLRVVRFRQPTKRCKTTSSEAIIPLPRALIPILRAWLPQTGCEWLFPKADHTKPWTSGGRGRTPNERLKQAGAACGVGGFTPHSLRHSLATHLHSWWGASKDQVRQMLRHGDDETTEEWYIGEDLQNLQGLVHDFDFTAPRRLTPASPRKKSRRPKARLYRRRRAA